MSNSGFDWPGTGSFGAAGGCDDDGGCDAGGPDADCATAPAAAPNVNAIAMNVLITIFFTTYSDNRARGIPNCRAFRYRFGRWMPSVWAASAIFQPQCWRTEAI